MINCLPPAGIFIIGAFLIPFLRGNIKSAYILLLPLVGFMNLLNMPEGTHWVIQFLDYELLLGKVDRLSLAFGYLFTITSFIATLYAVGVKDDGQHVAAFIYAGSGLGVVFAGDLLSLFIFWEIMALSATYIIWAARTERASAAGMRYFMVHIFGGLCLLAGIIMHIADTGSAGFGYIGLDGPASYLILLGFGINCAFPFLHAWLPDAYPEATFSGTVFLSLFTTKAAVYVLARAFPGAEILIWIGTAMAVFPIFYAVIENDLRKVLCFSLISGVGFMVTGIGIGTDLSLNGSVAYAAAHMVYAALLFMSMGAVLYRTGKTNATDLGGLYKSMPLTALFCIIAAASSAGFPFTSGFITKSLLMSSAGNAHLTGTWLLLLFASACVLFHSGLKVPFFAFFSNDSGIRTKEAPLNMLFAMGLAAFLCILPGIFPETLYSILPYAVEHEPYTGAHIIEQMQLLLFTALVFILLIRSGFYTKAIRSINLDVDWFYRKGAKVFMWFISNPMARLSAMISNTFFNTIPTSLIWACKNPSAVLKIASDTILLMFSSQDRRTELEQRIKRERDIYPGDIIKHWPIGSTVIWITLFLAAYLLANYLY